MRATAQIGKRAVAIKRYLVEYTITLGDGAHRCGVEIFRDGRASTLQVIQKLLFVWLVVILGPLDRLINRLTAVDELLLFRNNSPHHFFDFAKLLLTDLGLAEINIIIEPVLDDWPHAKFCLRPQPLHRCRHNVGHTVAHCIQCIVLTTHVCLLFILFCNKINTPL